jgi:hypothetical protein
LRVPQNRPSQIMSLYRSPYRSVFKFFLGIDNQVHLMEMEICKITTYHQKDQG